MIIMLKSSFKTTKTIRPFVTYWLCLFTYICFSQSAEKQIIHVEKMEYAYNPSFTESDDNSNSFSNSRIILAANEDIANKLKESILSAINNRWDATVLNPQWSLKEIPYYGKAPKFKTNLKKGIPGSWHLFLQVIDNGPYPITDKSISFFGSKPVIENLDSAAFYMQFKVSILDGSNQSVIFSNEMMVEMLRRPASADQILLQKLPGFTPSFLEAFDKAVQTLFAVTPQSELKLDMIPACLFLDTNKTLANAQKLNFVSKNDSVIELIQLKQEWIIQNNKIRKTKRKNNFWNNFANSSVTMLTGIGTEKIRAMGYAAKIGFIDKKDNAHYFCEIPYVEETREEQEREVSRDTDGSKVSENYLNGNKSVTRTFEPNQMFYLIREKDTIGHFKISKGDRPDSKNHFSQYWDGKNESTISQMPEFWNNTFSGQNGPAASFSLGGELNKVPFIIESSKAGNQTDIEMNGQEIMTLKMYSGKPVFGLLYSNPADEKTLSLLLMLSTMPFSSVF